jgi:para-aminobenzoate synthetase component 1
MKSNTFREHHILRGVDPEKFRRCLLKHSNGRHLVLFDRDEHDVGFSWMAGWGKADEIILKHKDADTLENLDAWLLKHLDWRMGYLSYDLKNIIEPSLSSSKPDIAEAELAHFFVPEIVFISRNGELNAHVLPGIQVPNWEEDIFNETSGTNHHPVFEPVLSKVEYVNAIHQLKQHIQSGDIYEINFCTEWLHKGVVDGFQERYLLQYNLLKAPFSCYLHLNDIQLSCHSPERYLSKTGHRLLSQPIKGTAPRFEDAEMDNISKKRLEAAKERSENVMIVDLVRNDLSRIALPGTVVVEELFGNYTFNQVHQLISSISCDVQEGIPFSEILKATFPMGSMTGAPKISAMELADRYEPMSRGIYSGSVGYFTPDGDFDFNVVIRSIIYHHGKNVAVARAGSAITWDADPQQEWEECLLKMRRIIHPE